MDSDGDDDGLTGVSGSSGGTFGTIKSASASKLPNQPDSHQHQLVPSSSSSSSSSSRSNHDPNTPPGPSTTTTTLSPSHQLTNETTTSHLLSIAGEAIQSTVTKVSHNQQSKCVNEKKRREQENGYIEELAELISAKLSSMSSLAVKPDKCAILSETVKQIRIIKQETAENDDLQASEVSSSRNSIIDKDVLGPLLLEALDGFLFVVNQDGKIEFVSENVHSFLKYNQTELTDKRIYDILADEDHARFSSAILPMSAVGNGFSWPSSHGPDSSSSTSAGVNSSNLSKPRTFNVRFRIKSTSSDDEDLYCSTDNGYSSVGSSSLASTNGREMLESMQISTVLLPYPKSDNGNGPSSGNEKRDMSLVCVARRMPQADRTPSNIQVEQFSTRLDFSGKVLNIDTSGVSSTYSQYLNKDLIGKTMLELCHPLDMHELQQHLEEALRNRGYATSSIYRLMVARDRYVCVQTKSRTFANEMEEYVMAAHSIIRDSDTTSIPSSTATSNSNNVANNGNNMVTASSSTSSSTRPSSSSVGGGGDPLPGLIQPEASASSSTSQGHVSSASSSCEAVTTSAVSYSGYTPMSPSTNVVTSDLLNDCLGLSDMDFPSSSWSDYGNNDSNQGISLSDSMTDSMVVGGGGGSNNIGGSDSSSHNNKIPLVTTIKSEPGTSSSPSYVPVNTSCVGSSSVMGSSSSSTSCNVRSPARAATPSSTTASPRAPTPFHSSLQNQSSYSPNVQVKSSPPVTSVAAQSPAASSSVGNSNSTDKLRNLLTQGSEDHSVNQSSVSGSNSNNNIDILRNLLNEDDDGSGSLSNPGGGGISSQTPFSSSGSNSNPVFSFDTSSSACQSSSAISIDRKPQITNHSTSFMNTSSINSNSNGSNGANNMLRMLLNDEDSIKHRNKSNSEMMVQGGELTPGGQPGYASSLPTSLNDLIPPTTQSPLQRFAAGGAAGKRKSIDDHYVNPGSVSGSQPTTPQSAGVFDYNANKRPLSSASQVATSNVQTCNTTNSQQQQGKQQQQQTQQLAGQNPMLASMLAQTPKTLPAAPITIPGSIVSQVPQEKLPKNLEKKLVHTPGTGAGEGQVIITSSTGNPNSSTPMLVVSSAQYQPSLMTAPQVQQQGQQLQKIGVGGTGVMIQAPQQQPGLVVNQTRMNHHSEVSGHAIAPGQSQGAPGAGGFLTSILMDGPRGARPPMMYHPSGPQMMSQDPHVGPSGQQQQHPVHKQHQGVSQSLQNALLDSLDNQPDPSLDDILDQVWSLQQEMNVDGNPVIHIPNHPHHQAPSSSTDDALLQILDEVLEPQAPNIATPTTPTLVTSVPTGSGDNMSERLAISAIQRHLMSFDTSQQQQPQQQQNKPVRQIFVQHQQQQILYQTSNFQQPPPPAYNAPHQTPLQGLPRRPMPPQPHPLQQHMNNQQRPPPQQSHFSQPVVASVTGIIPTPNYSNASLLGQPPPPPGQGGMPRMTKAKGEGRGGNSNRGQMKRQQQQMMMQQQSSVNESSHGGGAYSQDLVEMLNTTVPPNVSPFGSSNSPIPTSKPLNQSGMMNQGQAPQLSPGQRPPYSPHSSQQQQQQQPSYSSPTPSSTYAPSGPPSHRMSPHPYNVNSPHGPNSPANMQPHMSQPIPSPQPSSVSPQGWPSNSVSVRGMGAGGPGPNRMQASNPMLNAQLGISQQQQQQARFTQRPQVNMNRPTGLPSPGPLASTGQRNSPIPSFHPQSPGQFQPQPPLQQQQQGMNSRPGGPNGRRVQLPLLSQSLIAGPNRPPNVQLPTRQANSPRIMAASDNPTFTNYNPGPSIQQQQQQQQESRGFEYDGNRSSTSDVVKQHLKQHLARNQQQPPQQHMMQGHMIPSTSSPLSNSMTMSSVPSLLTQSPGLSVGSSGNEYSDLLDFSLDNLPDHNLVPETRDRQDSFSTLFESLASDIANSSASGLAMSPMAASPASLMRNQSINSPRMDDGSRNDQPKSSLLQQLLSDNT